MISIVYQNAYMEVLEILNHMTQDDLKKIPNEILEVFKKYANKEYKFKYNPSKTLIEQNVSPEARYIIAILFRDYWSTPEQRTKILKKEKYDLKKIEEEKASKYSYDKLFIKAKKEGIVDNKQEIALYNKTFFQKIIDKIKKYIAKC